MTNLSTLYTLVDNELGGMKNGNLLKEIRLMEAINSDLLVRAPEAAVRNILGFARSYSSMPSILLDTIEIYKN